MAAESSARSLDDGDIVIDRMDLAGLEEFFLEHEELFTRGLSIKQAVFYYGETRKSLKAKVEDGTIPAIRLPGEQGGKWRIFPDGVPEQLHNLIPKKVRRKNEHQADTELIETEIEASSSEKTLQTDNHIAELHVLGPAKVKKSKSKNKVQAQKVQDVQDYAAELNDWQWNETLDNPFADATVFTAEIPVEPKMPELPVLNFGSGNLDHNPIVELPKVEIVGADAIFVAPKTKSSKKHSIAIEPFEVPASFEASVAQTDASPARTIEQGAVQQNTVESGSVEQSIADQAVVEQSAAEAVNGDPSIIEQSNVEQGAVEQSTVEAVNGDPIINVESVNLEQGAAEKSIEHINLQAQYETSTSETLVESPAIDIALLTVPTLDTQPSLAEISDTAPLLFDPQLIEAIATDFPIEATPEIPSLSQDEKECAASIIEVHADTVNVAEEEKLSYLADLLSPLEDDGSLQNTETNVEIESAFESTTELSFRSEATELLIDISSTESNELSFSVEAPQAESLIDAIAQTQNTSSNSTESFMAFSKMPVPAADTTNGASVAVDELLDRLSDLSQHLDAISQRNNYLETRVLGLEDQVKFLTQSHYQNKGFNKLVLLLPGLAMLAIIYLIRFAPFGTP